MMKKMEIEINVLKEEKRRMKREIDEMIVEKSGKELTKKEQNKKSDMRLETDKTRKIRKELFPPLPTQRSSGSVWTKAKVGGPAEEYEEHEEDSFRVGEWDYVGRKLREAEMEE